MEKIGIGKASGKIILMGEHAVVYGQPAIAVPFFPTKVLAYVQENFEDALESLYYDGPLTFAPESLKNIIMAFKLAKEKAEISENLLIKIESSIPPERGMGSSAAVANAVIRGIFSFAKKELSLDQLTTIANEAEKIAHGNPSGIDQATTAGTHPIFFVKGAPFVEFSLNCSGYLLVCDSKLKGRTKETVAHVAHLLQKNPDKKVLLEKLGTCTFQLKDALTSDQIKKAAHVMNEAQTYLEVLGVSHPTLDQMLHFGLANGALGGKLTGGGGGGCVIFVTDKKAAAEKLQNEFRQAGYPCWCQDLRELN